MCVLFLTIFLLSEIILIIRKTVRGIIINVYKYPVVCLLLFLLDFNQTWIFPTDFQKKKDIEILNFLHLFQWKPIFYMQTDRQTNMIKLIVAFCYFANAPKNAMYISSYLFFVGSQKLSRFYKKKL
jgi:hypothetical protein